MEMPWLRLPCCMHMQDMVAEFEAVSVKMSDPDADIDALSSKMDRLQARTQLTSTAK